MGASQFWKAKDMSEPPSRTNRDGGVPEGYGTYDTPTSERPQRRPTRPWTAGRVVALVVGALLALFSLGLLAGGLAVLAFDLAGRDSEGYIATNAVEFESNSYAIVGSGLEIDTDVPGWLQVRELVGDIQLRVESTGGESVFIGIAREPDARDYLADIGYDEVSEISGVEVTYIPHTGGPPESPPGEQDFWTASTEGQGAQTLMFEPEDGRWVVVAMNSDGSDEVSVTAAVAVEASGLPWLAVALLIAGGLGLLAAALIIYLAVRS